jgi:hypothetical protein
MNLSVIIISFNLICLKFAILFHVLFYDCKLLVKCRRIKNQMDVKFLDWKGQFGTFHIRV